MIEIEGGIDPRRILILAVGDSLKANSINVEEALAAIAYVANERGKMEEQTIVRIVTDGGAYNTKEEVPKVETLVKTKLKVIPKAPKTETNAAGLTRTERTPEELALRKILGETVAKAREMLTVSYEELAELADVKPSTIRAMETSTSINPRGEVAQQVFNACGINFEQIESSFFGSEFTHNS